MGIYPLDAHVPWPDDSATHESVPRGSASLGQSPTLTGPPSEHLASSSVYEEVAWLEEEPRLWREPTHGSAPHAGRQRRKALLERKAAHKAGKRRGTLARILPELFAYPAEELVMHILKLPPEIVALPWASSLIKAVLKAEVSRARVFSENISRREEFIKS